MYQVVRRTNELQEASFGTLIPSKLPESIPATTEKIRLAADRLWDTSKWVNEFDHNTQNPAILQSSLIKGFPSHYKMICDLQTLPIENLRHLVMDITGIEFDLLKNFASEELVEMVHKVLSIKILSEDPKESATALILKMLLEHRDDFLSPNPDNSYKELYPPKLILETLAYWGDRDKKERLISNLLYTSRMLYKSDTEKIARPLQIVPDSKEKALSQREIDGICMQLSYHPFSSSALGGKIAASLLGTILCQKLWP